MIYIFCILYITILSRSRSMTRTFELMPFWSYLDWLRGNWTRGLSISLNVILFVPFGYLLADLRKPSWLSLLCCLFTSLSIEIVQLLSCLGYFDVDDIISNFVGGFIGVSIWRLIKKYKKYPLCRSRIWHLLTKNSFKEFY